MTDGHEPSTDAEMLADAAGRMSHSTESLVGQIAGLREDFRAAREQAAADIEAAKQQAAADVAAERRDRRRAGWKFALVVIADLVLSLVIGGLYLSERNTNHKLEDSLRQNYTTAAQQQVTRVRVLCPLYTLLLAAASNPSPEVAALPAQQARLAAALATIRDGYQTLGCPPLP
jgi:hypothetical protein